MRTALQCLAKAAELERRASRCAAPDARLEFLEAAIRWRDLARRALIHEQRAAPRVRTDRRGGCTRLDRGKGGPRIRLPGTCVSRAARLSAAHPDDG